MRGYESQVSEYIDGAKAFVFDMHDTLVDGKSGYILHNMELAARFGVPKSREKVEKLYGNGDFREMLRRLCDTDDLSAIMKVHAEGEHDPRFQLRPFENIPHDLRLLRRLGYVTGIFTATTPAFLERDLATAGYDPDELFDFTDTVYSTGVKKSDPASFRSTAAKLFDRDITPAEAVYVGDGLGDMTGSLGAGFRFVGIERGFISADEFAEHGVYSLPGVHELVNIIRRKHGQL